MEILHNVKQSIGVQFGDVDFDAMFPEPTTNQLADELESTHLTPIVDSPIKKAVQNRSKTSQKSSNAKLSSPNLNCGLDDFDEIFRQIGLHSEPKTRHESRNSQDESSLKNESKHSKKQLSKSDVRLTKPESGEYKVISCNGPWIGIKTIQCFNDEQKFLKSLEFLGKAAKPPSEIIIGEMYLVRPQNLGWCRGVVLSKRDGPKFSVHVVDYGRELNIPRELYV